MMVFTRVLGIIKTKEILRNTFLLIKVTWQRM